jgi:hypothetical protein
LIKTIISRLTSRNIELLAEMERKGKVTAREQDTYVTFAFYMNIGTLKKYGLVEETVIENNGRKYWMLTEFGKKLVSYIKQIEGVLGNGERYARKRAGKGTDSRRDD